MDLESFNITALITTLIVLAVTVLPFVIGVYLAKYLRMQDYGWKLGVILTSVVAGAAVTFFGWPPKLGVDLAGGFILIYEIDEAATAALGEDDGSISPAAVAEVLKPRLDPGGKGDIVIRPYGDQQIEIILPDAPEDEIDNIKRLVSTSGYLEFRIVANRDDPKHNAILELAESQRTSADLRVRRGKQLYTPGARVGVDSPQAMWVGLGTTQEEDIDERTFRVRPFGRRFSMVMRDAATGNWITFSAADAATFGRDEALVERGIKRFQDEGNALKYVRDVLDVDKPEVLVATNEIGGREVKGKHVARARADINLENGTPSVSFNMTAEGASNMGMLTSTNVDEQDKRNQLFRYLGIVLDGQLLSAPSLQSKISDRGQITGSFTQAEVDNLVAILREGHLPAVLNPNPTTENEIAATLGDSTIRKGSIAIGASLAAVLLFMLIYYRFAGIVACLALTINLVLIVAFMVAFKAAFTLPGLAGLVLTVGMSVDANVLIFERIREERRRGAALRMAIRNGFGRATTTIVDANITTLITAIVLYGIGTDQVQGFAVTLILGILMSMYTAIFVSRVIFDIAERLRWITELNMMAILGETNLNFIGKRVIAAGVSAILIAVGVSAIIARGADIFDTDFMGGTSAQIVLVKSMPETEVRDRIQENLATAYNEVIDEQLALYDVSNTAEREKIEALRRDKLGEKVSKLTIDGYDDGTLWKIDTSIPESEMLKDALAKVFRDENDNSLLKSYHLDVAGIESVNVVATTVGTPPPADIANPPTDPPVANDPSEDPNPPADDPVDDPRQAEPRPPVPPLDDTSLLGTFENSLALANVELTQVALLQDDADSQPEAEPENDTPAPPADADPTTPDDADPTTSDDDGSAEATEAEPPAEATAAPSEDPDRNSALPSETELPAGEPTTVGTQVSLTFDHPVSAMSVQGMVADAAKKQGLEAPTIEYIDPPVDTQSEALETDWTIQLGLEPDLAKPLLSDMETTVNEAPVFFAVSKIGASVAGNARNAALGALAASLLGIVAYIWFRFQRVVYGLAAVVALLHDVLIVIGAIALSAYMASALGFLMIEDFKISLPIVAALLTIIGYSLNDTIVVFDRIREVKGKSPSLTGDMINTSINQTLSRTLLTSVTTLLVVTILYIWGGEGIHGFAFALLIGVFVGTYSSVFVASPILLWLGGDKTAQSS